MTHRMELRYCNNLDSIDALMLRLEQQFLIGGEHLNDLAVLLIPAQDLST